jgi:hypothetical protein
MMSPLTVLLAQRTSRCHANDFQTFLDIKKMPEAPRTKPLASEGWLRRGDGGQFLIDLGQGGGL